MLIREVQNVLNSCGHPTAEGLLVCFQTNEACAQFRHLVQQQ